MSSFDHKVRVFGGKILKEVLVDDHFQHCEGDNYAPQLLRKSSLLIIQTYFSTNQHRRNGKQLIYRFRLHQGVQCPIILLNNSFNELTETEKYSEVQKDPLVRFLDEGPFLRSDHSLDKLLSYFPIEIYEDARDKELLFEDILKTVYNEQGILHETKHRLLGWLDQPADRKMTEVAEKVMNSCSQIKRVLLSKEIYDLPGDLEPISFAESCKKSGTVKYIGKQIKEYFDDLSIFLERRHSRDQITRDQDDLSIIYIGHTEAVRSKMKAKFEKYREHFGISCIPVEDETSALEVLRKSGNVRAVISDYRFRGPDEKIGIRNGYHIINRISELYPAIPYFLLTNYRPTQIVKPTCSSYAGAFPKKEVIEGSEVYFFRLAQKVIENTVLHLSDRGWPFPGEKNGKKTIDDPWEQSYQRFLKSPNKMSFEDEIGKSAMEIINEFTRHGLNAEVELPKVARKYRIDPKEKEVGKKFVDRLLVRRVIIGLLNLDKLLIVPGVAELVRELRQQLSSGKTNLERFIPFAIVYRLIQGREGEPYMFDNKIVSNNLGYHRILIRNNYNIKSPKLRQLITGLEYYWLSKNYEKLNRSATRI